MKIQRTCFKALFTTLLTTSCYFAHAQQAYMKIGGGYNFGIGSAIDYQTTSHTSYSGTGAPNQTTNYERVNINPGKGAVAGAAFGYMFNNNLGAELGIGYLAGSKSTMENEETFVNTSFNQNSVTTSTETYSTKSKMLLIQPSLVISSGLPTLDPYSRIGVVLAKGSIENEYSESNSNDHSAEMTEKLSGGWGFGLQAALGVNFKLNDKLGIYTEAAFNNLTYSPDKGELIKYNRDGKDMLEGMQTVQKEVIFENEQTTSSNAGPSSPSEPSSAPKQRVTMNSVGINVGLKFNF